MRRFALAALAATALAGCPLPQPLPDYPPGTITPPRILADGISIAGTSSNGQPIVLVPANCPTEPVYPLGAQVLDANTIEQVEARWFVNYHPQSGIHSLSWKSDVIPPDPDPLVLTRSVPPRNAETGAEEPFAFHPYQYPPPYALPPTPGPPWPGSDIVRVVELVVSNGFDPAATTWPAAALPNRAPRPSFETQVYRWVFLTVPASTGACDPATDPTCVKCP